MSHRAACVFLVLISLGCRDEQPTVPPPPVTPPPSPTASAQQPSPTLKPEQVVRLVTEAMGRNDTPARDAGIAVAFAFASPGNKTVTGPLERFAPMVKSPMYQPLIDYAKIDYAPIQVEGDHAEQLVTVTDENGEPAAFLWILTRQRDGDFKDCWMTDGVTRVGVEPLPPAPQERREKDAGPEIRV